MKKWSLLILLCSFSLLAWSEDKAPPSCQTLPVTGDSVVLHAEKPMFFLVHNLSTMDIWITHPVSDPGASAGWTSQLKGGNWSAMVLDKPAFEMTCVESSPGHEQQIPCAGVLTVCKWPGVKLVTKETGTYWVSENMSLSDLMIAIGGRGFSLPALDN